MPQPSKLPSLCLFAAALVGSAIVSPAVAQTTWFVPQFGDVQGTIDAAAPGDIIELQSGKHFRFHLDKGLTIRGPGEIGEFITTATSNLRIDVPPGQVARFIGIRHDRSFFSPQGGGPLVPVGSVVVGSGTVVFEGCDLRGGGHPLDADMLETPAVLVLGGHVVFTRTSIQGLANGLLVEDGDVAMSSTTVRGRAVPGRGVIECSATSTLHASDVAVTHDPSGGPGAALVTAGDAWLADSTFQGGDATGPGAGGNGIEGTDRVQTARTTVNPGAGAPAGTAVVGAVQANPDLLGVSTSSPPVRGGNYTFRFESGVAGASVVVLASFADLAGPFDVRPIVAQPLWTARVFTLRTGTADASGTFQDSVAIPLTNGLLMKRFDLHGARIVGNVVELAPVVTGVIR